MKKTLLVMSALMISAALPALAQPIESEPLGPAPYTLKNETDPMALGTGSGAATDQVIQPAPGYAPLSAADAQEPPMEIAPAPMPPEQPSSADAPVATDEPPPHVVSYPKSNVTGVPPQDPSKFEQMVFCTLKVSFGSYASGTDKKSGEAVKAYLDSNTDKLTYTRTNWGKEGEYNYCVTVKEHNNKSSVYTGLKRLIPAPGTEKGPVSLVGDGFATVTTKKSSQPGR